MAPRVLVLEEFRGGTVMDHADGNPLDFTTSTGSKLASNYDMLGAVCYR
jgi:hypothetical protein